MKILSHLLDENYRLIYQSKDRDEYILQRYDRNHNHIVRLLHRTYDWSNQLKRDLEQRISSIIKQKRILKGKHVHLHFIYISDLVPVDNWESMKRSMPVRHHKAMDVTVYYLDELSREEEWSRISDQLPDVNDQLMLNMPDLEEQGQQSIYLEQSVQAKLFKEKKRLKKFFSYGKSRLTLLLLVINIIILCLLRIAVGALM